MLSSEGLLLKSGEGFFDILKSDDLIIGGYASIEVVDKQNDLITLEALDDAVHKFMGETSYRNVMSNHSNVQVGEVIESYRDTNGTIHKTGVDDVGFYVVIKLREDIEKAKEISRGIRKGTLRSFSIGGQAISKRSRTNSELGKYNEIDKLELHEVTICEKGINPEAKFDILKQDVGGEKKMSEKLEKALEELNGLMSQVNDIRKEGMEEKMEPMSDDDDDDDMGSMDASSEKQTMETKAVEEEDKTKETKALDEEGARNEAGETVIEGGSPKASSIKLKGYDNEDFSTLNLSAENVEKAYEQFKAEQLEKIAYDDLQKQFAARFESEKEVRKESAERAEYDAKSEVAILKSEFAELRKSLTEKDSEIRKSAEVAMSLPDNLPTSIEDAASMSWDEIHNLARGD
jgi:HK97 family phage prohead protease